MFRVEGHEVNKREFFPFAKQVMIMANQISLNRLLNLDFNDKTYSFKDISTIDDSDGLLFILQFKGYFRFS